MPPSRVPAYRLHKARGLAVVTLSGRDFYLGPHGSDQSWARYHELLQLWYANGKQLSGDLLERSRPARRDTAVVETIDRFVKDYLQFAEGYFRKNGEPTGTVVAVRTALRYLEAKFGRLPISDFGPLALRELRQDLVTRRLSRRYVNDVVQRIRAAFRWGVSEERVSGEQYHRLAAVPG